jgi:hypothetical protein
MLLSLGLPASGMINSSRARVAATYATRLRSEARISFSRRCNALSLGSWARPSSSSARGRVSAGDVGFEPREEPRRGPTQAEGLPDILALLTPVQYRLITASRNQPVIIQGRAGSGKTTVALYRVAWLTYADEDATQPPVDPSNVLIVMFNRALSSFVRAGLKPLKLEAANVDTFHGWALDEIRRSYRGTIEIDTSARPGRQVASALKKQFGMIAALGAFVARQEVALERWLEEKLKPYGGATWMKEYRRLTTPVVRQLRLAIAQIDHSLDVIGGGLEHG